MKRFAEISLNNWLREGKSANAEVDYVISQGNLILPIEVKAGKSGSLKSLQQFVFQKNAGLAARFDLNKPGIQNVREIRVRDFRKNIISFIKINILCYVLQHHFLQKRLEIH